MRRPEFRGRLNLWNREPWKSVMGLLPPVSADVAFAEPSSQALLPLGPPQPELHAAVLDAWDDPATVAAFGEEQWLLESHWEGTAVDFQDWAQDDDRVTTALFEAVVADQPFAYFATQPVFDRGRLVEVPVTMFARSYLELVDLVGRGLRPVRCEYCRQWFPPRRAGQRYCPGTSCRTEAYAWYEKDPHRREYQRLYKKFKRGTITQDEWDRWRDENPGPDSMQGDDDGEH
jgi:hypothetical protein